MNEYQQALEAAHRLLENDATVVGGMTADGRQWWRANDIKLVARMFLRNHAIVHGERLYPKLVEEMAKFGTEKP